MKFTFQLHNKPKLFPTIPEFIQAFTEHLTGEKNDIQKSPWHYIEQGG